MSVIIVECKSGRGGVLAVGLIVCSCEGVDAG